MKAKKFQWRRASALLLYDTTSTRVPDFGRFRVAPNKKEARGGGPLAMSLAAPQP
jgi:hypothetical protein